MKRLALITGLFAVGTAAATGERGDEPLRFARDVQPILASKCWACHGPDEAALEADLRLDRREDAVADRGGYAAVVPGDAEASELVYRIFDDGDPMPPEHFKKPLTEEEKEVLRRWVEEGAAWEGHWAWTAPVRPAVPELTGAWMANDVDRFVAARHAALGIEPSPQADARTLVRRLSFDLRGLPPEPEWIDALAADPSDAGWEALVETMLDTPGYGERMAVWWLDLVRYGDSGGYHSDNPIPMAPYREWVVRSFQENEPFDRFTIRQLAGDLLEDPSVEDLVASGYNRLNKTTEEGGAQPGEYLAKYMADRVRTTGSVWMGVTLGCAECHDHKYDPFSTREFYEFGAFFADLDEVGVYEHMGSRRPPEMRVPSAADAARLDEIARAIAALPADAAERAELRAEREAIDARSPLTLISRAVEPREIRVLPRGNWLDDTGVVVAPALPASLPTLDSDAERLTRLDLAEWLVRPEHPLTARVVVNRLWEMYFGKGLSARLDDLGTQGEWPVDPELLDWLAVEFVESGWDVQHVVRLLVGSRAYRQSSLPRADLADVDPENRLVARQSRWRVDAEFVRDTALLASGLLNRDVGGETVFPYQPDGYWDHLNFPKRRWRPSGGAAQYRRGLYTHWQRTFLHPSLRAFDAPSREECTADRPISNTPLAALALLNDPSYVEAARALAELVLEAEAARDVDGIRWAFERVLQRAPSDEEDAVLRDLLARHLEHYEDPAEAWSSVARVLLNLDETITRP